MSQAIKDMLADRERAADAHEVGLRRELNRRLVDTRKSLFVAAFERQQRWHRMQHQGGAKLTPDAMAVCEGAELAIDPGWDAERAWRFSVTREAALQQVQDELDKRHG